MKKILLSFILLNILCSYIHPQCTPAYSAGPNIYTCNNTAIATISASCEYTTAQKANIRSVFLADYASIGITSADILDEASALYNCHGYAWHLKEGSTSKVWINRTEGGVSNLSLFWSESNPCFIETTEAQAEKIFYDAGDHSAVKSSVSGKYESKWGKGPVIRHSPTQVPDGYIGTSRKYYKKPSLSVPTIYTISGPSSCPNGQYADFSIVWANGSPTPTQYQWILNPVNGNNVYGASSSAFTVAFYNAGTYQVVCRAANANGWGPYATKSLQVYNSTSSSSNYSLIYSADSRIFTIAPASGSNVLPSSSQQLASSRSTINYTLTTLLTGAVMAAGTLPASGGSLDFSALPAGIYVLLIDSGNGQPDSFKISLK